jgi:predicted metal-dependent hydrolase
MTKYPQAFIDYLIYFHAERDFFECHEVLEEYWKEHPADPLASAYVGCIQVAVALYHQRRGNLAGAVKMLGSSLNNFRDEDLLQLGIEPVQFRAKLLVRLEQLADSRIPYSDFNIPLSDPKLEALCVELCIERKLVWQGSSDFTNTFLIHKHTLRDRSEVIAEREQSRQNKQAAKRELK